jgi:LysM repeat protein
VAAATRFSLIVGGLLLLLVVACRSDPGKAPGGSAPGASATAITLAVTVVTLDGVSGTPTSVSVPSSPASGSPVPTPRPAEYVVQSGDTLSEICSDKVTRPESMGLQDCIAALETLNGIGTDIQVGQILRLPSGVTPVPTPHG